MKSQTGDVLRVIHVTKATGISGSERHLLSLLPALRERGVETSMVLLLGAGAGSFLQALNKTGVPVKTIHAGPDLNPLIVRRLQSELRRSMPELVHTHLIHGDLYGQVAARLSHVPALSSVHSAEDFYRREPYRSAARLAGHLARRTIAISGHVARTIIGAGVVEPGRVRIIHYGIDASHWTLCRADVSRARGEYGVLDGETAVGVASRLVAGKGHEVLIQSVSEARRRGARLRLLVAGTGPNRAKVEALARSQGIASHVLFLGFVHDVRHFLAACDTLAVPTQPQFGEGFGLVALEAMATGLPVVATRVASLPEVVEDNQTGLLTEPNDVQGLADALVRLTDADLRSRLGARGRDRAIELFSLDAMADATLAVYHEVLDRSSHGRAGALPSGATKAP